MVFLDSIGVGGSVYAMLRRDNFRAVPLNFAAHTFHTDKTGTMAMSNIRAAAYWGLREALDPESKLELALPSDPELRADLCAPRWRMTAQGVLIESKEDIVKRLGRSPDCADAVALAWYGTSELMRTNWSFAPAAQPSQPSIDLNSESTLGEIPEMPTNSPSS